MKSLIAIAVLVIAVTSCGIFNKNSDERKSGSEDKKETDNENEKEMNIGDVLRFGQPVLIDSSEYVIYPLLYTKAEDENFIERKIYDSPTGYVNMIFYNTGNGQYHLLDSTRKMLIHNFIQSGSYAGESESTTSGDAGMVQSRKNIFYMITTSDHNDDGLINNTDPKYLFMSDPDGRNFKQISPDKFNVVSWKLAAAQNVVLILTVKDTNGNLKFDKDDETIPFVYDKVSDDGPKEIFSGVFRKMLAKDLKEQWKEKEK